MQKLSEVVIFLLFCWGGLSIDRAKGAALPEAWFLSQRDQAARTALKAHFPQQPDASGATQLHITPSASFLRIDQTTLFVTDVNLRERLREVLYNAGYETGEDLLQMLISLLAFMVNPFFPDWMIYTFVQDCLGDYRFLKIWRARALLASRLAQWGYNLFWRWWLPEHHSFPIELSLNNQKLISELGIPLAESHPLTMDIHFLPRAAGSSCSENALFDSLVCSLDNMGIVRWEIESRIPYEKVLHTFTEASGEAFEITTESRRSLQNFHGNTVDSRLVGEAIDGLLSTDSLLELAETLAIQTDQVAVSTGPLNNEELSFIPLGCYGQAQCSGVLVAPGHSGEIRARRVQTVGDAGMEAWLQSLTRSDISIIFDSQPTQFHLPDWLLTVAFEVLEEIIQEVGFWGLNKFSGILRSHVWGSEEKNVLISGPEKAKQKTGREFDWLQWDESDQSPLRHLYELVANEEHVDLDRCWSVAQAADDETLAKGLEAALRGKRREYSKLLAPLVPDDQLLGILEKAIMQGGDLEVVKFLVERVGESYQYSAFMKAARHGRTSSVGAMLSSVSEMMLDSALVTAAESGRLEIIDLLYDRASASGRLEALLKADNRGWLNCVNEMVRRFPGDLDQLPEKLLRNSLRTAIDEGDSAYLDSVVSRLPKNIADEVLHMAYRRRDSKAVSLAQPHATRAAKSRVIGMAIDRGTISEFDSLFPEMSHDQQTAVIHAAISADQREVVKKLAIDAPKNKQQDVLMIAMKAGRQDLVHDLVPVISDVAKDKSLLWAASHGDLASVKTMAPLLDYRHLLRASVAARHAGYGHVHRWLVQAMPQNADQGSKASLLKALRGKRTLQDREAFRALKNQELDRIHLGNDFYIYRSSGQARRAFVVAHGNMLNPWWKVIHRGRSALHFLAPDASILHYQDLHMHLERDFRISETVMPMNPVHDYGLSKDHNPGRRIAEMAGFPPGLHPLIERKATPMVLSGLAQFHASTGVATDIISVRKHAGATLTGLVDALEVAGENYDSLILGNCRSFGLNAARHILECPMREASLKVAPGICARVLSSMKLDPELYWLHVWKEFKPHTGSPEEWLKTLSEHGDRDARQTLQTLSDMENTAKKSRKH